MLIPLFLLAAAAVLQIAAVRDRLGLGEDVERWLLAAFWFFLIVFVIRVLDWIWQGLYARRGVPFPLPDVLHTIILAVLYILSFFIILRGFLNFNITPFLATSALLTMILGLAFQGVLSNILSGLSLHFTKSFSKGDWVEVGSEEGVVIDTNWRETRIFNRASNVVVIPNNTMASEKITNISMPQKRTALILPVMVGFAAAPTDVFAALRKAAEDVPAVLERPAVEAHLLAYEDLGVRYAVKFWITDFSRKYHILAEVGRNIWFRFRRRGIEIPVALNRRLREVTAAVGGGVKEPEIEHLAQRRRIEIGLIQSTLLRAPAEEGEGLGELLVPEEAVRELAASVRCHRFASGEVVFRQGDKGESCFVLTRGLLRGQIIYQENGKSYTSDFNIGPFGIFGEMSLLTGMPRTATGIVEEEAELLEIRSVDFAHLLERHPQVAERLAEMVSRRNQENEGFLQKIKELSAQDIAASTNKHSILDRLKSLILR